MIPRTYGYLQHLSNLDFLIINLKEEMGNMATYPIHTHTGFTTVNLLSLIDSRPQKELPANVRPEVVLEEVVEMRMKSGDDMGTPAGTYSSDTGLLNLSRSSKDDLICLEGAAAATGWIGLGFRTKGVHVDSDMYILRRD